MNMFVTILCIQLVSRKVDICINKQNLKFYQYVTMIPMYYGLQGGQKNDNYY